MSAPEFSRTVPLDAIGTDGRAHAIEAGAAERLALAARFDLIAVDRLAATLTARREGDGVRVTGHVIANVTQACTVSGEPVPARVAETVDLRLAPPRAVAPDEEVELAEGELDELPLVGDAVDLGEIAAETMALALDPYPRAADDVISATRARLMSEEQAEAERRAASPFAKLRPR